MSNNIVIKEDGNTLNLSVDKIQIGENYIFESEAYVANLEVWRNGNYTAKDFGVSGFDTVTVDLTWRGGEGAKLSGAPHIGMLKPDAGTPEITEGGIVRSMGGTRKIAVNKQGGDRLLLISEQNYEPLSISKEGNYAASADGKYAYSSVAVDVPYGGGGGGGGGGGETPFNPNDLPSDIIYVPFTIAYTDQDMLTPEIGDVKAYVATENPYGGTSYSIWEHAYYPNGIVPLNEITFSPKILIFDEEHSSPEHWTADNDIPFIPSESLVVVYYSGGDEITLSQFDPGFYCLSVEGLPCIFGPSSRIRYTSTNNTTGRTYTSHFNLSVIYGRPSGSYYLYNRNGFGTTLNPYMAMAMPMYNGELTLNELADVFHFGTKRYYPRYSTQEVTASWKRPLDGQLLTDTASILVYENDRWQNY